MFNVHCLVVLLLLFSLTCGRSIFVQKAEKGALNKENGTGVIHEFSKENVLTLSLTEQPVEEYDVQVPCWSTWFKIFLYDSSGTQTSHIEIYNRYRGNVYCNEAGDKSWWGGAKTDFHFSEHAKCNGTLTHFKIVKSNEGIKIYNDHTRIYSQVFGGYDGICSTTSSQLSTQVFTSNAELFISVKEGDNITLFATEKPFSPSPSAVGSPSSTAVCLQENVGLFPDTHKMRQRTFKSVQRCREWCDATEGCVAIAISPRYWAHRECFLVSTSTLGVRSLWSGALKSCWNKGTPAVQQTEPSELPSPSTKATPGCKSSAGVTTPYLSSEPEVTTTQQLTKTDVTTIMEESSTTPAPVYEQVSRSESESNNQTKSEGSFGYEEEIEYELKNEAEMIDYELKNEEGMSMAILEGELSNDFIADK